MFLRRSLPDDYRCGKSLGPVESLQEHPQQPGKILIGYSRGLVVLWDLAARHVEQLFLGKQVGLVVPRHPFSCAATGFFIVPSFAVPCSSWRAWRGSAAGTCSSARTTTAATRRGPSRRATPAASSRRRPPSRTVRNGPHFE